MLLRTFVDCVRSLRKVRGNLACMAVAALLGEVIVGGCAVSQETGGGGVARRVRADFPAEAEPSLVHYVVPAMSDVQRLPDAYPEDGVAGGTVRIVAARDEFEPGSFLVWSDRDLGKVQFTVGELKNENGDVFPAADLDLKVVKVWWQNRNGWFSYFGDTGFKLLPELLLHDEDLIRVDERRQANYARLVAKDGTKSEQWLNPPRQMDRRPLAQGHRHLDNFHSMREDFDDAKALQPVAVERNRFKQFFLTAHVRKDAKPGVYRGVVKAGAHGEIPVAIRVLDFTLPAPKAYMQPEKDFLVSAYSSFSQDLISELNGYDYKAVDGQLAAIFKNLAEHNQTMHMIRGDWDNPGFNCIEAMRKGGMRTDTLMTGGAMGWLQKPLANGKAAGVMGDIMRAHAKRLADDSVRRYGHKNLFLGYGDEPGAGWFPHVRPVFEIYQDEGLGFFIAGHNAVFFRGGYLYDWYNTATDASRPTVTAMWNKLQNGNHVAWYAVHHTGTENPSLNRRQYGLTAYLNGYTAFCNYEHNVGSFNDDTTTYKPMALAYSCHSGLIDTLQWEGFREGIDDIRYATLMTDLARKAQKFQNTDVRYVGGKAMQFLALLDVRSFDMYWAREEMIRFIEELRPLVAPYDAKTEMKMATAEERAAATKRLEDGLARDLAEAKKGFATAEGERGTNEVHRKVAQVYKDYFRDTEAGDYLLAAGLTLDAAKQYFGKYNTPYADRVKGEEALLKYIRSEAAAKGGWGSEQAFWEIVVAHPEVMDRFEAVFFSRFKPTDTNALARAAADVFKRIGERNHLIWQEAYGQHASIFERTKAMADRVGAPVPAKTALNAFKSYLMLGRVEDAAKAAASGLSDPAAKPDEAYALKLAGLVVKILGESPDGTLAAVREFDGQAGRGVSSADREKAVCAVGNVLTCARRDELVRGLNEFRKGLLRPKPKKRYVVRFSERKVGGASDWDSLDVPETAYDRRFGGDLEFLETDVVTGNRGDVGSSKEDFPFPTMKVVADVDGVHFLICSRDPKAGDVALGLANGGTCEGYIAPGENQPYICMLAEPDNGQVGFFNTMYSTFGNRALYGDEDPRAARIERTVDGGRVITHLFLSWRTWATKVPEDGTVWDFENIFWSRAGGFCWNGAESIHGRSTWGELEFRLTAAQRRQIMKPLLVSAYSGYKDEKGWRKFGFVSRWKDDAVGDPEFYDAVLKPVVERLDGYGEMLSPAMSDETVDLLVREALPRWNDFAFEVQRLRTRWLLDRQFAPSESKKK